MAPPVSTWGVTPWGLAGAIVRRPYNEHWLRASGAPRIVPAGEAFCFSFLHPQCGIAMRLCSDAVATGNDGIDSQTPQCFRPGKWSPPIRTTCLAIAERSGLPYLNHVRADSKQPFRNPSCWSAYHEASKPLHGR